MKEFVLDAIGPKVEQINDQIKISNFPINLFRKDLLDKWSSSKILNIYEMAFHWYSGNKGYLKFHQFFAPEFMYILSQLPKRRAYKSVIKDMYEKTWIKITEQEHPSRINLSKLSNITKTLKPYQREWLNIYDQKKQKYRLKGYLNATSVGGGKTGASITTMECLGKEKIIVVAPNNTLYVTWEAEIRSWLKDEQKIWSKRTPDNPEEARWYIVNYESLPLIIDLIKSGKLKCNSEKIGIIVDEVHNFRNHETKRSIEILEIANLTKCQDIVALSGTPIKALGKEMITLTALLDPMFNNTEIQEIFKKAFGLDSAKLADIIAHRLGLMMFRVLAAELNKLPDKHEETIKVKIPNGKKYTLDEIAKDIGKYKEEREKFYSKNFSKYESDYKEALKFFERTYKYNKDDYTQYKELVKRIKENIFSSHEEQNAVYKQANLYEKNVIMPTLPSELKKRFKKAKSVYKYVTLVILGEVLGNILPTARLNCYKDIITYGPVKELIEKAEKKTIIFTTYSGVVEHSLNILSKEGYKPIGIYTKTSKQRDQLIGQFKTNEEINPLVTSIQMMSTGVTLNEANTTIFAPTPFRYTDYEQAMARCYRIGQDTDVYVYTLTLDTDGKPNISTRIQDISDWSKSLFMNIVGVNVDKIDLGDEVDVAQSEETMGTESIVFSSDEKDLWLSGFDIL